MRRRAKVGLTKSAEKASQEGRSTGPHGVRQKRNDTKHARVQHLAERREAAEDAEDAECAHDADHARGLGHRQRQQRHAHLRAHTNQHTHKPHRHIQTIRARTRAVCCRLACLHRRYLTSGSIDMPTCTRTLFPTPIAP